MPEPDFTLKRGDTASRLQATLENSGGTPVSVEAATVLLKLAPIAGRCGKRLGGQEERNCKVDDPHACLRCRIVDLVARLPQEGA